MAKVKKMPKKMQAGFQYTPEILRELLNPINKEELLTLLKDWGIKKIAQELNKVETFLKSVGTKLSQKQIEDLWLLREKELIFRSRSWILFKFTKNSQEIKDFHNIQQQFEQYLVSHQLKFNNEIKLYTLRDEIYINLIYHGPFRLYEENTYDFKVIRSVQRIRCLINLKLGILRMNGRSLSKIQLLLSMIKEMFGINPKKIPIPAYIISDFIKDEKPIKKLIVTCPRMVGGFSGIEKIVVEGPNVVEGLYNLQSRQEIPFSFQGLQKVGPWTEAKSNSARITNRGEIQISDESHQERLLDMIQD